MDHLGIDKFMVLGYCIGGPFIWNLIKRAPSRVAAAVLTQLTATALWDAAKADPPICRASASREHQLAL